jgi:hypothetical protein
MISVCNSKRIEMTPSSPNATIEQNTSGTQSGSVQIHLRLPISDATNLKRCADERGQTISAFVRFVLRYYSERNRLR